MAISTENPSKTSLLKKIFRTLGFILLLGLISLGITAAVAYANLPSVENINSCFTTSMYQVELCPSGPNYVKYNQLPKHLVSALIASEDSSFFFHKGFDWDEIEDSLQKSFDAGRWVRGGSTLTQQLAKNLYLSKDRTLTRKIKEFYVAGKIEKVLTKPQIIEKYLNVVEFGEKIYGIKRASNYYFQKAPSQLSAAESAYLVSLLPSPVKYSRAYRSKKELSSFNKKRSQKILHLLKLQGNLSEPEFDYESARIENGLWTPMPEFPEDVETGNFSDIYFQENESQEPPAPDENEMSDDPIE
ncbi:MAG: transglycosylase domain-containing protein [Bdellovibrionales bacterium]|nr:transglycosylase domain-containing protein [Bdellovibrionales bacterium]